MVDQINVSMILALHRNSIIDWKLSGVKSSYEGLLKLIQENHAFNFQLWHAEDRARRDDLGYEFVYRAKREIDSFNQQRNNRMEMIDSFLVEALNPADISVCAVHSETPGMMIDRLSILALKIYHMGLQLDRSDVDDAHKVLCRNKCDVLWAQQKQLSDCLEQLILDIKDKKRTFRVYYQLKMYNDPKLNPQLYQANSIQSEPVQLDQ